LLRQRSGHITEDDHSMTYSLEALCRTKVAGISGFDIFSYEPDFIFREACTVACEALESLPPRERHIIEARFGLTDEGEVDVKEIAARWDLTSQRVCQIISSALLKLKCHMAERYGKKCVASLTWEFTDVPSGELPAPPIVHPKLWALLSADNCSPDEGRPGSISEVFPS